MMKLLITGGLGYLGGRLAEYLASQTGYEIYLGSRQQIAPPSWLPQATMVKTEWDVPMRLEQICTDVDAIVHLAGMNAQDCAAHPLVALESNAVITARLLQSAVRQKIKRFVYLSTAHVYGSPLKGMITEETCSLSLHPYATSHRAGEDVVRISHQQGDIEGIVIRLSNAYGAPTHKEVNCWMLLVNDLCRQVVMTGHMKLHSSGLQRRDFITLTDTSAAIQHLLELPTAKLADGLFNVGGAWSPTILEMTKRVAERVYVATGNRPEILRKDEQKVECSELFNYGIEKLVNTGFHPSRNIEQEIDRLIQFCFRQFL